MEVTREQRRPQQNWSAMSGSWTEPRPGLLMDSRQKQQWYEKLWESNAQECFMQTEIEDSYQSAIIGSMFRSIDWLIDWRVNRLFDWSMDWLIDWLIDWFGVLFLSLHVSSCFCSRYLPQRINQRSTKASAVSPSRKTPRAFLWAKRRTNSAFGRAPPWA